MSANKITNGSPTTTDLSEATSQAQVLEFVRDYVGAFIPWDITRIPAQCRPGYVEGADQVAEYALELTRASITMADPDPALAEMALFFAGACARLAKLQADQRREREASELLLAA